VALCLQVNIHKGVMKATVSLALENVSF